MDEISKPTPDPTVLTTEQLLREIDRLKELSLANNARVEEVFNEKMASVDTQFALIERQRVEQKTDTATAVAAALSAAKEAVREQTTASEKSITKSETATAEQLRQLTETFRTAIGGVTDSLTDIKERVGKIESRREGALEVGSANRNSHSDWVQTATLLTFALSVVLTAVIAAVTHGFH